LQLRHGAVPADSRGARDRRGIVLRSATQASQTADWLASARTSTIAWWLPKTAMVATLLAPVPIRATVWTAALGWMGAACILNSRRCGRTHCRYTGPYYLAIIVPVIVAGVGIVPLSLYGWIALGIVALGGSGTDFGSRPSARGQVQTSRVSPSRLAGAESFKKNRLRLRPASRRKPARHAAAG